MNPPPSGPPTSGHRGRHWTPSTAERLDNPVGTACGFALDIGKVRFPGQPDWTGVLGSARVKAIQIQNFGPCIDEVAYELL